MGFRVEGERVRFEGCSGFGGCLGGVLGVFGRVRGGRVYVGFLDRGGV